MPVDPVFVRNTSEFSTRILEDCIHEIHPGHPLKPCLPRSSPPALFVTPAQGEIVVSGGGADLTFFYDRPNEKFDVVFR